MASVDNPTIKCKLVSWYRVRQLAQQLAILINRSPFQPDMIVAIARGGYVPARLLCDFLQVYDLTSIRVEHYAKGAQKKKFATLKDPLCTDPSGNSVLIVDDVCDTGDTYLLVLEYLRQFDSVEVKTAALHHKQGAGYRPDFVAQYIETWHWLIYPWAITEDVIGFIELMENSPGSTKEILKYLESDYGLTLTEKQLQDILQFIER